MPKVKCPECGSSDTARIAYGLLEPTKQLEESIKNKKIYPGGCDLTGFVEHNRHCNNCENVFDTPAIKRRREEWHNL